MKNVVPMEFAASDVIADDVVATVLDPEYSLVGGLEQTEVELAILQFPDGGIQKGI